MEAREALLKKKKKGRNKILASMPANWEEEEKKFFEAIKAGKSYDPQFQYDDPKSNTRFLKMFPAPKYEFLDEATNIIESFLKTYGSLTAYLEK